MTNRRGFLGYGIGSFLLAACGSRSQAAPRDALPVTPQIPDDDAPPADAFGAVCAVTADNIEGPFYRAGAPHRTNLGVGGRGAEPLVLGGTVRTTSCEPIAGAVLDVWHADERGGYDNDGWGMRGRMTTDSLGRWQLKSIVPGRYLNGRRYRPTHIHVKLRAKGHRELTTQLYFEGDPYNEGDDFIVDSLIMQHRKVSNARRASFDFVLAAS